MKHILFSLLTFTLILFSAAQTAYAQEWRKILNLKGYWKFNIGDDKKWAFPNYDDSGWEEIKAPSYWEDEGFNGYNGYAWYRKTFEFPSGVRSETVYLDLGTVDDIDEVYINGNLVGYSGSFPPDYKTAYWVYRKYPVPMKYLKTSGKNLIAVRVYDAEVGGGINSGNLGLYVMPYTLVPDLALEGEWKFKAGDDKNWSEAKYNDKQWDKVIVPGYWESQGYPDYNGFGWYRLTFNAPDKIKDKNLVLLLGKIDDLDEVYLNGQLIGSTGKIYDNPGRNKHSNEYQQFRGYYLPTGLLKFNQENTIAVRVYDGYINGGIYEGPIGIITQDRYTKFWREKKKSDKNLFRIWFDD